MRAFGLFGTITADTIAYDDGRSFENIGGILYQAAVLCGLGIETALFTNCGADLAPDVERLTGDWAALRREGMRYLPGPGNRVVLRYGERLKEREEVLRSVGPPLDPASVLARLPELEAVMMVFNSGYDLTIEGWRSILAAAACPVWFDVHSLVLAKRIGAHRDYVALKNWREWIAGTTYLQANRQEVACLLGHPERRPEESELPEFFAEAFDLGVRAVFVTLGKDGVWAAAPGARKIVPAPTAQVVVDTTGCGDVFAASAFVRLVRGAEVLEAARYGVALATEAVAAAGIRETYALAVRARFDRPGWI